MTFTISRNDKGQFIKKEERKTIRPTFLAVMVNVITKQTKSFMGYKKEERETIKKCIEDNGEYEIYVVNKDKIIYIKNGIVTIKENQNYIDFMNRY